MPTEQTDFIAGLDQSRPQGSESLSEADDHLRLTKKTITATFVGSDGNFYDKPVTAGPDDLNAIPTRWADTVDRTTDQTVGGVKAFTSTVQADAGVVDANGANLIERQATEVYVGAADGNVVVVGIDEDSMVLSYADGAETTAVLNMANVADLLYPVDSIIHGGPDPSIRFPGTTWQQIEGRVVIGAGTGTDDNDNPEAFAEHAEAGEYSHQLTIPEMPAHTHDVRRHVNEAEDASGSWSSDSGAAQSGSTGGDAYHNNIQPYRAAYIWLRTA